eukprot:8412857-Ditylum_brightwellii.AAC.1
MESRRESKQKKDCYRKSSCEQRDTNKAELDDVAERMRKNGGGYVDDESKIKTPVEAQWILTLVRTMFNTRAA